MEIIKSIIGVLTFITGILSAIGGAIATKYWLVVTVVLSILKLAGLTSMPWFAGITTASAIGTGLWMLSLGVIFILLGLVVTAISTVILGD